MAMLVAALPFICSGFVGGGTVYPDGRPAATLRLEAKDQGVVLKHGDGPGQCDMLGARDVWVYESGGTYYMHYDGAGPKGWGVSRHQHRFGPLDQERAGPGFWQAGRGRLRIGIVRSHLL